MSASLPAPSEAGSYRAWLEALPGYSGQIVSSSFFPPRREGEKVAYAGALSGLLEQFGITPYRHQAEVFGLLEAGRHVVVATPTASGKSLCFQLPTLHALQAGGTALYLYPTKALSHDQLEKLRALAAPLDLAGSVVSYDGDTPRAKRTALREQGRCVLTNPDMLHYGILPFHERWAALLGSLRYLVLDELHSYRGVMGVHVANILRRLLRLARHYGAQPQLIAASATIANPAEHARNLSGLEVAAVSEDAGPRAAREFVFWQPPLLNQQDARRRSLNTEAAQLAAAFVRAGLKSIFFCNSRKSAELLRRYAADQLGADAAKLQSYRAGYTPEDRRRIEQDFKRGDITVLAATSALELGVDIGGVDAVVLVGYPGSMTALWQRAGRAGRGSQRALTLLMAGDDPLDSYYLVHPERITEGQPERAVADAWNSEIHPLHVACAAAEKPVQADEGYAARWLEPAGRLVERNGVWHYLGRYPHRRLSVRGTGGKRVLLKDGSGATVGVSDLETALRELHPGAVYLQQGETYLVARLDLQAGVATLLPHLEDYYTQVRSVTEIDIVQTEFARHGLEVGRVRVATEYGSYVKKRYFSEATLDERLLELPEVAYPTQALWFDLSQVASAVPPALLPSAMHALEHALIGLLPAFVLCERADVGGVSYPLYPATGRPVIFIYDGYPGGVGYARAGWTVFAEWLGAARELLAGCPCREGCPRCILSPKCGNGNQYLDKGAALQLAEALLAHLALEQRVLS